MKTIFKRLTLILLIFTLVLGLVPYTSMYVHAKSVCFTPYIIDDGKCSTDETKRKRVMFNEEMWNIIKDESSNAGTEGTVTLLAAESKYGDCVFGGTGNDYNSSTVKSTLDAFTAPGGSFENVAYAIKDTDYGKLYLLSEDEMGFYSSTRLSNIDDNWTNHGWWLRTPLKYVVGNNIYSGTSSTKKWLRPAVQLDCTKVFFDTASLKFWLKAIVPTVATDLTYDGSEKTGVVEGTGYTLSGTTTATNEGTYTATATLKDGFIWSDGTSDVKTIEWSIGKKGTTPNKPDSTKIVGYDITTVSDVVLPANWKWADADKDKALEVGKAVTATAIYDGLDKGNYETESVEVAITRVCEHEYGEPTYTWSSDNKTCTATAVCNNEGCTDAVEGHKVSETVKTTSAVKTDSTTEKKGVTTYNATFTNKLFEKQSKDVEDIAVKAKPETPAEQTATDQKPTETTPTTTQTPAVVEKGKEITVEKKGTFEVTSDATSDATSKTNTATFTAVVDTKAKSVTIPDAVTVDGKKYEVTEVSAEALKNSSATTVTIGKNVTTLAPNAFTGSNVKTITIKSKKLTKQSVKNSFKGLKVKKLIVKVKVGSKKENKKYIKKYKKFFTKKNIGVKAVLK